MNDVIFWLFLYDLHAEWLKTIEVFDKNMVQISTLLMEVVLMGVCFSARD